MITVIVSVLNNARGLKQTLTSLVPEKTGHQVLVADGGSRDDSLSVAKTFPWAKVVKAAGTRAARCNAAGAKAKGEILLFLNAGTVLERGWPKAVMAAAEKPGFKIGCFRLQVDAGCLSYRLVELEAYFRTQFQKTAREQQAVFVKAADFPDGQVFVDAPALETQALCRRLSGEGKLTQLGLAAITPPNRWSRNGVLRRTMKDRVLEDRWAKGEPIEPLLRDYGEGRNAVMMFCKPPDSEDPKPWLTEVMGEQRCSRIYRSTVDQLLATIEQAQIESDEFVFYRPKTAHREMAQWIGGRAILFPETGRSDGDRRQKAFNLVSGMAYDHLLMLGTHCPAVEAGHLRDALDALQGHDLVLGPTDDGGCYLVGVKAHHETLFRDVSWSPETLMDELCQQASALGLSVARLEVLRDFDSVEDLDYNWAMGHVQA